MNKEILTNQEFELLKLFANSVPRKKACAKLGVSDYRYSKIRQSIVQKMGGINLLACMTIALCNEILTEKDFER